MEVLQSGRTVRVETAKDSSILEALSGEPTVTISAPCGGAGRCGKCLVRVIDPVPGPPPSQGDRRFISSEKLTAGYRLACTCEATRVSKIEISGEYREASVKGELPSFHSPAAPLARAASAGSLAAAVDIGTTTVAIFLIDTATGEPLDVLSQMNRQSVYGADVLTRIAHAENGGLPALSRAIRAQIQEMLTELTERTGAALRDIGFLTVVGNTTMLHLLVGEDPSGIGRAPFTPAFIDSREYSPQELSLPLAPSGRVLLVPCVSAYVGADIVSAAVAIDMDRESQTTLLVDIGTNGELLLRQGEAVFACSTAAGPALEGATIRAGVGGVAGAISGWHRAGNAFEQETIGGGEPVGICGSGLLDLLATLLTDGIVDETGRMTDGSEVTDPEIAEAYAGRVQHDENGEPMFNFAGGYWFTQQDLREIQLAKAAIAAGIDTLLDHAGMGAKDLERVVLTGGFGQHLDVRSAQLLGLLPVLPAERFLPIAGGAGIGAVRSIRESGTIERMLAFQKRVEYIELSGHPHFQNQYIERMTFPEAEELARVLGGVHQY